MIAPHTQAILWAQWRSLVNFGFRRRGGASIVTGVFLVIWYGIWVLSAWTLAGALADVRNIRSIEAELPSGLLLITLYWQIVPIMMASSGLSLELSRLMIYPIPHAQLFRIELVLRTTTAIEMLVITAGLFAGLMLNASVPRWAPPFLIVFVLFNVLLSAGLRDLVARLFARRGIREVLVFVLVLVTVIPQALMMSSHSANVVSALSIGVGILSPWTSTARLIVGRFDIAAAGVLAGFTALAGWFARAQFERSLRFDSAAERSTRQGQGESRLDALFRLADDLLPSPLGALVSKELRFLSRAPRFRLLFLMGCSFGLIIWLPLLTRSGANSEVRSNYLTVVTAYALMLLGEALFWNQFGMDRSAAQTYFVTPVPFTTVLKAKNIAAAFFVALETTVVAVACLILHFPVTPKQTAETFGVISVLTVLLLGAGNIMSARYPRPVDPGKSWRNNTGRSQAWLMILYPVLAAPVLLAYGARYAFGMDAAFWFVIAIDLVLAGIFYSVALDSAAATALRRREDFVQSLAASQTPVTG